MADHDQAGADYAAKVTALAKRAGATSVRVGSMFRTTGRADGTWRTRCRRRGARTTARNGGRRARRGNRLSCPNGFRMTDKGLFYDRPPCDGNPNPQPVFVTAPFQIIGQTRSDTGEFGAS